MDAFMSFLVSAAGSLAAHYIVLSVNGIITAIRAKQQHRKGK